jgi:ABC-type proline/glycine betaine transport system ATPase subunit
LLCWPWNKIQARVDELLQLVHLPPEEYRSRFPRQLSGGQQQRVGIARAIVTDPAVIVADEPTGDLDAVSAEEILNLLCELQRSMHKTIVMVTHDPRAAARADRILHLEKGQLVEEQTPATQTSTKQTSAQQSSLTKTA